MTALGAVRLDCPGQPHSLWKTLWLEAAAWDVTLILLTMTLDKALSHLAQVTGLEQNPRSTLHGSKTRSQGSFFLLTSGQHI